MAAKESIAKPLIQMSFLSSIFGSKDSQSILIEDGCYSIAEALHEQRISRKQQYQRIGPSTVRITVGNEITDYHVPFRENEVLWEIDFSPVQPMHKYFGRFKGDLFTGIKYNYGYVIDQKTTVKYVESLFEYKDGVPNGLQIFFNTQGDVIRREYTQETEVYEILETA